MTSSLGRFRWRAVAILILGCFAGFVVAADRIPGVRGVPAVSKIARPFHLGLDLVGGTHLLYQADFSNFQGSSRSEAMEGLRDVIERRVNLFGVAEPVVQVERAGDDYRLIVELAGVKDIREAIRRIGETPSLAFKEPRLPEETKAIQSAQAKGESIGVDPYFRETGLTGRYLKQADLQFNQTSGEPEISVEFNGEGAALFEKITGGNVGRPLGIYLDGTLLSAPTVREKISGGRAQITGKFTLPEAREMVRHLNSGALPVPVRLVNQETVEAALGAESLRRSMDAAVIGFLSVMFFMILWYRLPGLVAVAALLIYAAVVLLLFKFIPVTLTAAGIAGFVLSLGMAVDANILIFERMKEELARRKPLEQAIREGFSRAWTSIRDSNVSSLITAAILYWLGTSVVRGFALTLGIGILVSMVSAIFVSRTFLLAVAGPWLQRRGQALVLSGFTRPKVGSTEV